MSIVSLQVGQCGNQVGAEFFKTIFADNNEQQSTTHKYTEYCQESMETFFNVDKDGKEFLIK